MLYNKTLVYSSSVQFEDVDLGGGVHNPNYLKYFERARNYHLRNIGITTTELIDNKMAFVLSEIYLKFKKSLVLEQNISIFTKISALKKIGFKVDQYILSTENTETEFTTEEMEKKAYAICSSKLVCVDLNRKKIISIPEKYLNIFLNNHDLDKVNENINLL